jgi:chorismate mutase
MSSLTAAFSQVLSQQREEEEAKRVEESVRAVQNGMFAEAASAAAGGGGSTKKNLDAAATVTCFDLVTSTAARVPLAKIIAASNPAQATATIEAAAAKSTSDAKTSDTYVVIQPIDWSVHHADCTFARLTAVNQGADAVDNILLELSSERDDLTMEVAILRKQMASKDHVIEDQRGQIKQLQEQLQEEALAKAQKQQGGSSTTTSSSSSTSAAASSTSPAKARAPKIHESESEGSEEEVEEDEEEDQLDEEQGDFQ